MPVICILYLLRGPSSGICTGGCGSVVTWTISFLWGSWWNFSSKWHLVLSSLMWLEWVFFWSLVELLSLVRVDQRCVKLSNSVCSAWYWLLHGAVNKDLSSANFHTRRCCFHQCVGRSCSSAALPPRRSISSAKCRLQSGHPPMEMEVQKLFNTSCMVSKYLNARIKQEGGDTTGGLLLLSWKILWMVIQENCTAWACTELHWLGWYCHHCYSSLSFAESFIPNLIKGLLEFNQVEEGLILVLQVFLNFKSAV